MKVINTIFRVNKCDCGAEAIVNDFISFNEIESIKDVTSLDKRKLLRIAICNCGNIFLREYINNDQTT